MGKVEKDNKDRISGQNRLMGIEREINEWFENTQNLIAEVSSRDGGFSLTFCAIAVPVMKTYCRAAALLLDEGFKLPAMALIRIISEFFIKFLWCVSPDDENEIRNRLQRWDKTAGKEKLRLYKGLLELEEGVLNQEDFAKVNDSKEKVEKDFDKNGAAEMPRITGKGGLFEGTSKVFGVDVSAILYSQYCSAVHVDTSILCGLKKEHGEQGWQIRDDIDESLAELKKRCVNFVYMFLLVVHKKKNWGIEAIEQEYKTIIGDLSTKDGCDNLLSKKKNRC